MNKTAIITGISGQDGAYLSEFLLHKGYQVVGLTRAYTSITTSKLAELNIDKKVIIEECDLLDYSSIFRIITKFSPSEIYNLAAQSSVYQSFKQPISTLNFNTISVVNLLEIIRNCNDKIKFYQATSSEMYGEVKELPITEESILNPRSPYAISKATAHWTVRLYRESYGLFACNGILFNHESKLRDENFFIKKLISSALRIKNNQQENLILGNLDIKRDFGYSPDYVQAMFLMLQQDIPQDFIICSGKSIFLKDIVHFVFDYLEIDKSKIIIDPKLYRPSEIKDIYGSNKKAKSELNWNYNRDFFEVIKLLIENER
jgi:GDPmannose 4,6-dehydratase